MYQVLHLNGFFFFLGLLTINECEEVLKNRRERQKKNAFSHLFCNSIWEKHETVRFYLLIDYYYYYLKYKYRR